MLQIRKEQYDAFDADMRSRYCKSLLKYYRDTIAEVVAPYDDATLFNRIVAAEGRGRQWGIALQDAMARFIGLDLVMGERFDTLPEVQRLFKVPGMSMDMKIHVLSDMVQENLTRVLKRP